MTVAMKKPKLSKTTGRSVRATWAKLPNTGGSTFHVKDTGKRNKSKKVSKYDACDGYEVEWQYAVGAGSFAYDKTDSIKLKATTWCDYDPPDEATKVRCRIKPLFRKYKTVVKSTKNGKTSYETKDKSYYTGSWSTSDAVSVAKNVLDAPSAPSVEVSNTTATVSVGYKSDYCGSVTFEWELSDGGGGKKKVSSKPKNGTWLTSVSVGNGTAARARSMAHAAAGARSYSDSGWSDWSSWSDSSTPGKPTNVQVAASDADGTVCVSWDAPAGGADEYEIQYVHTSSSFFSGSFSKSVTTSETQYYINGLDSSLKWFFRVRSVTGAGESAWAYYGESIAVSGSDGDGSGGGASVDTDPTAPTSWQSDSVAAVGEGVTLSWVHNCEDGCTASSSTVHISVNGGPYSEIELGSGVYGYLLDTSPYKDGDKVSWYVTTVAVNGSASPASPVRAIELYERPSVHLSVSPHVTQLPVPITVVNGGTSGAVAAYECAVKATDTYYATSSLGEELLVVPGQTVWSCRVEAPGDTHVFEINAGDALLAHCQRYSVTAAVASRSGLRAESDGAAEFETDFSAAKYSISCEIEVDADGLTCDVTPVAYLADDGESTPGDARLSVLRIESGGGMVPLAVNIPNSGGAVVTDRHPRLDTCSYRVVATDRATGASEFEDFAGDMGCGSVVIQWESGRRDRMLELEYNLEIQEEHDLDVALTEYIGRQHPVSSYGTQKGHTATLSADLWADDYESIDLARELLQLRDDCYYREPTGTGYWAHVDGTLSEGPEDGTMRVSLKLTRVDRSDELLEVV